MLKQEQIEKGKKFRKALNKLERDNMGRFLPRKLHHGGVIVHLNNCLMGEHVGMDCVNPNENPSLGEIGINEKLIIEKDPNNMTYSKHIEKSFIAEPISDLGETICQMEEWIKYIVGSVLLGLLLECILI